jgi:hypothetical protein
MATEAAESAKTSASRPAFIRAVLRILLSFFYGIQFRVSPWFFFVLATA